MERLYVSASPHLRTTRNVKMIMLDVIISLIPAIIASAVIFGVRSLLIIGVTVLSCVIAEYISRKVMKRENSIGDLSAVVTGILLAFNLPVSINPLIAVLGSIVAIVIVKQMFGGIGQNFVNPALAGRIVLMVSFPTFMTTFSKPMYYLSQNADAITTATPLALIKGSSMEMLPSYIDMFLGMRAGCLGETCSIALILGGIYLVIRKVIKPAIPLSFTITVFILSWLLGVDPIFSVLSGGVLLGAIFMATDYTTSPLTFIGKIIFGIGCGGVTVLIRQYDVLPEGVSYSIVLMNILVPYIEKLTKPRAFGQEAKKFEN